MSSEAHIVELFVSVDSDQKRIRKENIEIDPNGIVGDKFYAKNLNRLILLTSLRAYELAKSFDINLEHGSLGENILIDYDISHLRVGDTMTIGDVVLEITQECTLCNGLSVLDAKLPTVLKTDRGLFAKAIIGGIIKKNDTIII